MLRVARIALLCLLALPHSAALAQTDDGGASEDAGTIEEDAGSSGEDGGTTGGLPGGGIPDASVGEGGADRDNEQGDDTTGRVVTVCDRATDCSPGFSCSQGRCTWIGVREAEGGFGCSAGGPGAAVGLVIPLALLGLLRLRESGRRPAAPRATASPSSPGR